nr:DNA integrity scanning diadenylate cyclase DisA [Numidum massiliense]
MCLPEETAHDREKSNVLRLVAPGTDLRDGLDNVLRAMTGALIVIGYDDEMEKVIGGGFHIDCPFSPAYLYELAKMDGGIILSGDAKRILYANTHLNPNAAIHSAETGIRHQTAERVAKQTGKLVISISQRRHVITLYKGQFRYALKDIGVILTKANQAVQTLEKYKSVLDQSMTNLSALEFENLVTLHDVAKVIQRFEQVLRIKNEIEQYINELGTEGRLIRMQVEELVAGVEAEERWLIKDYVNHPGERPTDKVLTRLRGLASDELLDKNHIVRIIGFTGIDNVEEAAVAPRGYRLLHKIPRLPQTVVENLIRKFSSLAKIVVATAEQLDEVDGIGEVRARMIKDGLKRIQEQVFVDRHI